MKRRGWNDNFAPRDERQGFPDNRCSCNGTSLDHLCRVHGNHPSSIEPPYEPGECDNTRGPSSQGERDE